MLPELGNFAIILALCFSLIQFFVPFYMMLYPNRREIKKSGMTDFLISRQQLTKFAVFGQWFFLSFSMCCLIGSFIVNDMTVVYVREHSHHLLPLMYRIAASWGGHEGSLLLWCLIIACWTFAFVLFSNKNLSKSIFSKILMTLGIINAGFILFLFTTSNPFKRDFPHDLIQGNDLTPLLQDPGLLFHPPSLYLGYVGFSLAFAFAIAALIEGKFDKTWVTALRPWLILPWAYLGVGIVLGSWWAYRELGWGGWWFWDPVENASLLPWLSGTALLHSLIVSEKRDVFKGWTLLLAIITFGLSLIGTFLVRSGVLVSVHAFANDPARGVFLLAYLTFIIGGAFLLYGLRINRFYQAPQFQVFSRETVLLINSVALLIAMITIIIGTLYPIILDTLQLEKISVGEPYFNTVFLPMMLPLLLLMGFAPHMNWGQQSLKTLWKKCRLTVSFSFVLGIVTPLLLGFPFHFLSMIGISIGIWIILATLQYMIKIEKISLQHYAMIIAHVGVAILVLGITINKSYSEERQVKILPGETVDLAGFHFTFKEIIQKEAENYTSLMANFLVQKNNRTENISAEERMYTSHNQTLSHPGIHFNAFRDLYLALGTSFDDGSWSVRIYYKPFVRWIWFGGFLISLGGLLSLLSLKKGKGC